MSEQLHYAMLVQWSIEDQAYLVTLPEWEGKAFNPVRHGGTYEGAVKNGLEALEALVGSANKHGEPLPQPRLFGPMVRSA